MLRFRLEPMACDAFYVIVFKSLRFHLSTLETERLQNDAFSDVSTFETVFESLRFHRRFSRGRFSVDDRRKRIKKGTVSNENALVWMGPQTKTAQLKEPLIQSDQSKGLSFIGAKIDVYHLFTVCMPFFDSQKKGLLGSFKNSKLHSLGGI